MLDDFKDVVMQYADWDIRGLKQLPPSDLSSMTVTLGGIFNNISRRVSKDGKKYITAVFEDMTSQVNIIAFNSSAAKYSEKFVEETLLFITGEILMDDFNTDDENSDKKVNIKISVKEIFSQKDMFNKKEKILHLEIPVEKITPETEKNLKSALNGHPGNTGVIMHILEEQKDVIFRAGNTFRVSLEEELFRDIDDILGRKHYRVEIIK